MDWVSTILTGGALFRDLSWGLSCPWHCGGNSFLTFIAGLGLGLCFGIFLGVWVSFHLFCAHQHPSNPPPQPRFPSPRFRSRLGGYLVHEWSGEAGGRERYSRAQGRFAESFYHCGPDFGGDLSCWANICSSFCRRSLADPWIPKGSCWFLKVWFAAGFVISYRGGRPSPYSGSSSSAGSVWAQWHLCKLQASCQESLRFWFLGLGILGVLRALRAHRDWGRISKPLGCLTFRRGRGS